MEQYSVTGMSCAACSARVEKAVCGVDGVVSCSVSLLTNTMTVEGNAESEKIINAVKSAGYGASKKGAYNLSSSSEVDPLADTETPILKKRLVSSLAFLLLLMYVSMGHVMWGFPLPAFLENSPILIGIIQLILSSVVMVINRKFFINGTKGLIHRSPNMDTLVSLGALASFGYSLYSLIAMAGSDAPHAFLHQLYFESASMILTLITLGKMLESMAKGKTTNALRSLMNLAPKMAIVIVDGKETETEVENLQKGDVFVVRPGGSVPVDGIVIDGHSAVDESALTGESIPVDKKEGDCVSAATINKSGFLKCEATRVGEETTINQIVKMVSDATATKAPIAKIADKVSGVFVPVVMAISVTVLLIWLLCGADVGFSLSRAVSVLVISCPCALGLATPVAIMVGTGKAAKNGILFKNASSLELAGRTTIVALDKTGTVTKGEPEVTDIFGEETLLQIACSLEVKSEHPLAKAIVKKAMEENLPVLETTDFEISPGGGVLAKIDDENVFGGSVEFVKKRIRIPEEYLEKSDGLVSEGKTVMLFAKGESLLGIIAVADGLKPDSASAVLQLKNMGLRAVMLTGDNKITAQTIANEAGIEEVMAELKPDGKENAVKLLEKNGKVAMVGDGINDAPSLTRADIGIAIGAGTDVAIEAADIVLVNSKLSDVAAAIRISRATLRVIKQNLFWAFIYNVICIPIAAGAFVFAGLTLSPMLGAAAMSLSSFCVVTNALRLNFCDIHSAKKDRKIKNEKHKEKKTMERVMKIEGMMCPHCEARVKKVLEEIEGVSEAVVSHTDGTAIVFSGTDVSDEALEKIVTENGYKVLNITRK